MKFVLFWSLVCQKLAVPGESIAGPLSLRIWWAGSVSENVDLIKKRNRTNTTFLDQKSTGRDKDRLIVSGKLKILMYH